MREGLRPWRAGQSGNPAGGNAPALKLARKIRVETNKGEELVSFMLSVMRGERVRAAGEPTGGQTAESRPEALSGALDRGSRLGAS